MVKVPANDHDEMNKDNSDYIATLDNKNPPGMDAAVIDWKKCKKYVLLVADRHIPPGAEIDVAELLKQRKEELGL